MGFTPDRVSVTRKIFGTHAALVADIESSITGSPTRQWQVMLPAGSHTLIVTCTAPRSSFDEVAPVFTKAIESMTYSTFEFPPWLRNALIGAIIGGLIGLFQFLISSRGSTKMATDISPSKKIVIGKSEASVANKSDTDTEEETAALDAKKSTTMNMVTTLPTAAGGLEPKPALPVTPRNMSLFVKVVALGLVLVVVAGAVWYRLSQRPTASESAEGHGNVVAKPEVKTPHDLNLAVITSDGATHDIHGVQLTSENDLNLPSYGFSTEDLTSIVILTDAERPREEQLFIRREILESHRQTYHALILPMSTIDRIAATGKTIRSPEREDIQPDYGNHYYSEVSVTMRNGEVLRAITSQNLKHDFASSGPHELLVNGTEDLHDFGKAAFTDRLGDGDLKEIKFPPLPPAAIATKSAFAAVITEVGGRTTRLSDLRFEGGTTLIFIHTGSTVQLNPSSICKIELHQGLYDGNTNAIAPDRIAASVLLNSGAQQDFEWKTAALVGRTTGGWYEWIPGAAIKTVDFGAAR